MKRLYLIVVLLHATAFGVTCNGHTMSTATASVCIFEVDGITQNSRSVTYGQVFKAAEIPSGKYPQPVIEGTPAASGNWQADCKNAWSADSSWRFCIISLTLNLASGGSAYVTYQQANSGNNTGFLTAATIASFDSGGGSWGAQAVITPASGSAGAAAKTIDFKTMSAGTDPGANTFPDCKNDYWLKGPVVTLVIVQDCTSASAYDIGWHWNNVNMASDGAAASYVTTSQYASIHPMALLAFYPAMSAVQAKMIIENPWTTRVQDQSLTSIVWKTGQALTTKLTTGAKTLLAGNRWPKTFWSGTAPGHVRLDQNWEYLKATYAFPNYDSGVTVTTGLNDPGSGATSYAVWAASDKGDLGGTGGISAWTQGYSDDSEGAPIQREELLLLYNMTTCGTANSECAKAWDILTGEVDANASTTLTGCTGGCGAWGNTGNVIYHGREGRTTATGAQSSNNAYYCPTFASKDTTVNSTSCGSTNNDATGKTLSRHAHSGDQFGGNPSVFTVVGTQTTGGWQIGGCDHWLDYSYTPYLLTGDYFQLENEYQGAAVCLASLQPDPAAPYGGASFFAFMNHGGATLRETAWGLQVVGRAAFIAPDGTPEASYHTAMMNSTIEIEEGLMGLTGTDLTPAALNCSGASCTFDATTANRWDWGRAFMGSACLVGPGTCTTIATALHTPVQGYDASGCTDCAQMIDSTKSDTYTEAAWGSWWGIVTSELWEMGFTQARFVAREAHRRVEELALDSGANMYASGSEEEIPVHDATQSGSITVNGFSTRPYINTWAKMKAAGKTQTPVSPGAQCHCSVDSLPGQATFDGFSSSVFYSGNQYYGNASAGDHGYSLALRAAASFLPYFGTSSADANCPGGTCTAADAWTRVSAEVPYFTQTLTSCDISVTPVVCSGAAYSTKASAYNGTTDQQIKFALASRGAAVSGNPGVTVSGKVVFGGKVVMR